MPHYLHQFKYKDGQIRDILEGRQEADREEIVRAATAAFDGTLHGFYFAFGEYDGIAITEFENEKKAMACAMVIFGQGRVQTLRTTPLIPMGDAMEAIALAKARVPQDGDQ